MNDRKEKSPKSHDFKLLTKLLQIKMREKKKLSAILFLIKTPTNKSEEKHLY